MMTVTYTIEHHGPNQTGPIAHNARPERTSALVVTADEKGNYTLSSTDVDVDVKWLAEHVMEIFILNDLIDHIWKERDEEEKQIYFETLDDMERTTGLRVHDIHPAMRWADGYKPLHDALTALYPGGEEN